MRGFLSAFSFLLTLSVLALAGGAVFCALRYTAPGPLPETVLVVIEKGSGVAAIARTLADKKVIETPLLFRLTARLTKTESSLKAGEYEFTPGISMKDVLKKLSAGDVYLRQFTVPEGYTSRQVVRILEGIPELQGDIAQTPPEGSLLPETYRFVYGQQRADIVVQMQKAMQDVLTALWAARAPGGFELSEAETVILASIVEKETGVAVERPRIAAVFLNRLKLGMKLQSDPTVIYALTQGDTKEDGKGPLGRRLLQKDLETDSPYNTYKYPGLPPGPIANPGRAAIEAVLNPEKNDFLYFVADGTGGHVFSKTLAEHERNAAAWRKVRKEKEK